MMKNDCSTGGRSSGSSNDAVYCLRDRMLYTSICIPLSRQFKTQGNLCSKQLLSGIMSLTLKMLPHHAPFGGGMKLLRTNINPLL